jgi:hypothetical protein
LEYSLPDTFRLHNGEGELIFLDPDVSDVDADVPKDVPKINNSKNTDVLDVDKSKREDNLILPPIDEKEVSKLNISLIEQKCYVNTSGCQQIVKPSEMGAISTTSDTSASSLDREKALRRDAPTVGPNPRKDAPTPSKLKEDVAEKHTKEVLSYSDMVQFVPYDTSSPEAEQICTSIRGQLAKGTAPRIDFVRIDTKLSREIVELYMDNAAWLRKDDSAQSGIVVYLPVEPSDVP